MDHKEGQGSKKDLCAAKQECNLNDELKNMRNRDCKITHVRSPHHVYSHLLVFARHRFDITRAYQTGRPPEIVNETVVMH